MKEQEIIENLKEIVPSKGKDILTDIGDDTAVVKWDKDFYLLLTTDVVVEDVHFRKAETTPYQIGWKALAVDLSDIAAMGGIPLYALVSLGLPEGNLQLLKGVYRGIKALAKKYDVKIIGGNISKSPFLFVNIFLAGKVERKNLKLRRTAKAGDLICITGKLGGAQVRKHLSFTPRIEEVRALIQQVTISSMIDISDGLSSDLIKLAQESKVGFKIYLDRVPVSKDTLKLSKTREGRISHALNDGEDYEILFTVPKKFSKALPRKICSVEITKIGEIISERKYYGIEKGKEIRITEAGFDHFTGT
ncbi:MAG TPA: thiamine-phosphate kinase [Candidatus Omnitrophica bacterium]|nr:thiamine-phosphate kinase [Candidatus Omnitrophota bacterium]